MMLRVRKGQAPGKLSRVVFHERFVQSFKDPWFDPEQDALARVEDVAWKAYSESRKAPLTRKAGEGFADPTYDLSIEWLETRDRLRAAEDKRNHADTTSRVLVVVGAPRNDGSCPGEISKTFRLAQRGRSREAGARGHAQRAGREA